MGKLTLGSWMCAVGVWLIIGAATPELSWLIVAGGVCAALFATSYWGWLR